MNTQVRLITRTAFGFHDPRALLALAFLASAATASRPPEDDQESALTGDGSRRGPVVPALPPECTALVTEFLTTGPTPTWMPIRGAARSAGADVPAGP